MPTFLMKGIIPVFGEIKNKVVLRANRPWLHIPHRKDFGNFWQFFSHFLIFVCVGG